MDIVKQWPTLYKRNSNGSIQQWTISVVRDLVGSSEWYGLSKVYGQVDGKLQTSETDWVVGKNAGKANATTDQQQAELEAQAQWVKKKSGAKGYTESLEDAQGGIFSDLVAGGVSPMLAHKYGLIINGEFTPERAKKILFPCYAQPKLNGQRCLLSLVDGTTWSRDRKPKPVPHISEAFGKLGFAKINAFLDGELYNHDFNEHLEDISHMIAHGDDAIQYHVYDIAAAGMTFEQRLTVLRQVEERLRVISETEKQILPIRIVETVKVESHDELVELFGHYRHLGYEGLMVRNAESEYDFGQRSSNLLKLKGWVDSEFKITGVKEGRGKMAGKAVFQCVTGENDPIPGVPFDCSLAASMERRAEIFENADSFIGKMLTVRYAYYTQEGKPFHLVGQAVRDYE